MSTTIKTKKNSGKSQTSTKAQQAKKATTPIITEGEQKNVPVSEIDFSPLNYRKFYSHEALHDFASVLAVHGVISPLTLRRMPSGRYELVVGERRLRAAIIAELKEVPAVIKVLSDEKVRELQLIENLQREDPHPMNEAQAIGEMRKANKSIEQIASLLGKSKKYVYSRLKFLDLIEPIQEMFFANAVTMQEAFDIAALSAESQQELFDQHCANWKEDANFQLGNLRGILRRYKYDLKNAPFNIKDKKLLPEMGACTNCPFNSATLKSLFPELADQAICTKRDCYETKCNRQFTNMIRNAVAERQPDGILYGWGFAEPLPTLLDEIDGIVNLPRYQRNNVFILQPPAMPDKEEYMSDGYDENAYENDDEPEEQSEELSETSFDEAAYKAALYEYEAELEEYNGCIEKGDFLKGLLITNTQAEHVLFSLDTQKSDTGQVTVTAKAVQEAIKTGNATPELLQAEIDRINGREERAKQLDEEKIQLNIHTAFWNDTVEMKEEFALTAADLVAARLLLYQSLDYSTKAKVNSVLFAQNDGKDMSFFEALQQLSEHQYAYLIRIAIGAKSEGKFPNNETGQIVRNVAYDAGINIALIEEEQQKKAVQRNERLAERVGELERKIKKMQSTTKVKR